MVPVKGLEPMAKIAIPIDIQRIAICRLHFCQHF